MTTNRSLWGPLRPNLKDRRYSLRLWWLRVKHTPWRKQVLTQAVALANALQRRWYPEKLPPPAEGKMLQFIPSGVNLGHVVLSVRSVRGGMYMGVVSWSNQWGRARFRPDADAVFDQQCIAEIYAAMRDFK